MALICYQCIETGRLAAQSDPVLQSSASVSASAGELKEGGKAEPEIGRRSHQAGFKTVSIGHILKLRGVLGRTTHNLVQDAEV